MRAQNRHGAESEGFSDVRRVPNRRPSRMEARGAFEAVVGDADIDFAAAGPVERGLMRWENAKVGRCRNPRRWPRSEKIGCRYN